ncbi:MAG: hypothetical protein Q8922_05665 [Bacteroidota bacterium]|nr:hypothetical protein [Bacteroidota bacterium]MDP4233109.1 hypothetical protein [Bacteroidota bacterium]MDP4241746.1 hypothetical protein [Bacteroidota bacterium]MDP4287404.1 hypothetical protein [Bacteroidota bacterium]
MKKLTTSFAFAILAVCLAHSAFAQNADSTFKPHGQLVGQLFADYYYMMSADTVGFGGKGYYEPAKNSGSASVNANTKFFQAFDVRRVQLGYNYMFTKTVTGKFLLEHESGATGGDVLGDNKRGMYVKEASIAFANAIPMGTVIVGQQATNVFSVDEGLMGYRPIEKSLLDMRGMSEAGSNDLGIQLVGNIDKDKNFGYSAMISNGVGAKDETDKYKDFTGEVNAKFLDQHIVIDIAGDYMDKATQKKLYNKTNTDSATNVDQSNSLIKFAAAYTSSQVTVGIVYAMHTLAGQSLSVAGTDAVQTGLSIFARGAIIPKQLNLFARYDMFDPDSKASSDNYLGPKENFIVAGLDWIPDVDAQNVHVMPNIWMNTFKDKSSAAKDFAGITVARLTFSYKY